MLKNEPPPSRLVCKRPSRPGRRWVDRAYGRRSINSLSAAGTFRRARERPCCEASRSLPSRSIDELPPRPEPADDGRGAPALTRPANTFYAGVRRRWRPPAGAAVVPDRRCSEDTSTSRIVQRSMDEYYSRLASMLYSTCSFRSLHHSMTSSTQHDVSRQYDDGGHSRGRSPHGIIAHRGSAGMMDPATIQKNTIKATRQPNTTIPSTHARPRPKSSQGSCTKRS